MKHFMYKGLRIFLIGSMLMFFCSAVQAAKKNEPYLGPTVEECKINKKGDEKCKIKNLKGQKAIEFIYQALLEANAAIAENSEQITALEVDTEYLQGQINTLAAEISANDGEIAANAANISLLLAQLSDFQTVAANQAQDLLVLRDDLTQLANATAAQAAVVQGQIDALQGQITDNNNTILGLLADLQALVDSQGATLETVKAQIAELDGKIDTQVGLLQDAIAQVQSNLDDQESFTVEQFQYATDQRTLILADIVTLQIARDTLHSRADAIQSQVDANVTTIGQLAELISNNSSQIAQMQSELILINTSLAQKQDILEGNCPSGLALSGIAPDGAITCTITTNGITKTTVSQFIYIPPGATEVCIWNFCITQEHFQTRTIQATCPATSVLVGGYANTTGLADVYQGMTGTSDQPGQSWEVTATNQSVYHRYLTVYANCVSFP